MRRPHRDAGRRRQRPPTPLVILAGVGAIFFLLPLVGLLVRSPWTDLPGLLAQAGIQDALRLSLVASLCATVVSVVIGVPLAWVLARGEFRGRSLLRGLVTLPVVLPPVVGGVALFSALGRLGIAGRWLDSWFGVTLFGTVPAVIVAEAFVAMPFLILTVEAAFRSIDRRYEEAAATLGASRSTVFRRVTLPLIGPSLGAGAVLAWARALGEFGATITFAGNVPGKTQTVPLAVYIELLTDVDAAIALSLVLMIISLAILVGLRDRWWPGQ
jgi:molybdate transport system permease protein